METHGVIPLETLRSLRTTAGKASLLLTWDRLVQRPGYIDAAKGQTREVIERRG